jgi:eukaryotic-like serine/threonine-protein kinase
VKGRLRIGAFAEYFNVYWFMGGVMEQYLDGRYEVVRKIGGDGFGITYLVRDSRRPGNPECIAKQLRPDKHNPKFVEFFELEAKALEKLGEHPQIPQLLAHFEESQQFYIIQTKVDGKDLRDEIGQRPRSEGYVIDLLRQVLTALKFVHDQRIIHRDLKPGNLMRHRDGRIFLIDFGIVKELSTRIVHSNGDVRSTVGIGTIGYMAPEQGQGKPRYASDIYALGMTAICALTGIAPHLLDDDSATGEIVWQKGIVVRPALDEILTKMVRQKWVDRYENAGVALEALNRAFPIVAEPSPAPKPPAPQPKPQPAPQPSPGPKPSPAPKPPDPKPKPAAKPIPNPSPRPNPRPNSGADLGRRGFLKWLSLGGVGLTGVLIWPKIVQWGQEMVPDYSAPPARPTGGNATATSSPKESSNLLTRRVEFPTAQLNETGGIASQGKGQVTVYSEDLGDGVTLEMASISGGTFLMGSPSEEDERSADEGPRHSVTVPGFWMGQFEVTQAQWKRVAAMEKVSIDLDADPSYFKGQNRPVEQVSWDQATEFCARLSRATNRAYRLPSESEWEYTCRAGTDTPFSFGPTLSPDVANYDGNYTYGQGSKGKYRQETTDVGSFPANSFGLYDMHGNVWEWCQDWWHDDYSKAPTDGSAQPDKQSYKLYRLLRGGSWYNSPRFCRSAGRLWYSPGYCFNCVGFRVACSLAS